MPTRRIVFATRSWMLSIGEQLTVDGKNPMHKEGGIGEKLTFLAVNRQPSTVNRGGQQP